VNDVIFENGEGKSIRFAIIPAALCKRGLDHCQVCGERHVKSFPQMTSLFRLHQK